MWVFDVLGERTGFMNASESRKKQLDDHEEALPDDWL